MYHISPHGYLMKVPGCNPAILCLSTGLDKVSSLFLLQHAKCLLSRPSWGSVYRAAWTICLPAFGNTHLNQTTFHLDALRSHYFYSDTKCSVWSTTVAATEQDGTAMRGETGSHRDAWGSRRKAIHWFFITHCIIVAPWGLNQDRLEHCTDT